MSGGRIDTVWDSEAIATRLRRRHRAERRFRLMGRLSIAFAVAGLAWLLLSIVATGLSAFTHHWVRLDVSAPVTGQTTVTFLEQAVRDSADDADLRLSPRDMRQVISVEAAGEQLRRHEVAMGEELWVPLSDTADQLLKGRIDRDAPEDRRLMEPVQIDVIDQFREAGRIERRFNLTLFSQPDSRDPERAGIASALIGSAMALIVAALLALPVGIGSAIYLDEFAPRSGWGGRLTRAMEAVINNLAAVPSIVFGLLGLAVFINIFGFARSIPLVGGMVLALRMFPILIIASRASLQSVPPEIVNGALSLGASRVQAVFGQKLPVATPGILTGSILALAQALGETAPLLMIGMVAFVTAVPSSVTDPSTALPVQIFLWSDSPERAWAERTSAAILILLSFLIVMNGFAIWLRSRIERRYRS